MSWYWLLFLPAAAYQLLVWAALLRFRSQPQRPSFQPGVSILKPVLGLDPNTASAFRSQAAQDYPEFEILFGVRDLEDPVVPAIRQLQEQFPEQSIRLIQTTTDAPNRKVGSLIDLAKEARHPVWVVNDGDIAVSSSYLRDVVAPLGDPSIGVVTCPYCAHAHSAATIWESFGIATDFMPSTMVAQMLGVRDFGLGSTLAFRAADLRAAGGFEALASYVADDFQLAHRITRSGKRALLSRYVVETSLGEAGWSGMWHHQLRWARTIRLSKGGGYLGLPVSQAGIWALVALYLWQPGTAVLLCLLRMCSAGLAAAVLGDKRNLPLFWLAPFWDLFAFCVWIGAWTGRSVRWRNRTLRLNRDGTIAD